MDVLKRIDQLMTKRGWSDYRLSQESGLSNSTIANMRRRNTIPSITTLESICSAFGITLSQFFADEDSHIFIQLSPDQLDMFDDWISLTDLQKNILADVIKEFKKVK